MKVAIFFTYNYSLKIWNDSGVLNRELAVYRKLVKQYNYEFILFTYGGDDDKHYLNNERNIEVVPLNNLLKNSKNAISSLVKSFVLPLKLKPFITNIDILHQHQSQGSWVPLVCKFLYRKPLLIRTGYDVVDFSKRNLRPYYIIFFYKIIFCLNIYFSDLYTVASKFEFNNLKSTLNEKLLSKVKLRSNWAYVQKYKPLIERKNYRILSVGRLEKQKNYGYLINSFKNFDNYNLDIIGKGSEYENLNSIAKGNISNVNFLDQIDNIKLTKLYLDYKFYISTSIFEGNPKTILEAMGAGCIVICSKNLSHNELIEDKKNGFLFDFNNNGLTTLFIDILENKYDLESIAKEARNTIKNNYSLDKLVWLMDRDYRKIIKK